MRLLNNLALIILSILVGILPAMALELDLSVDEEIKRKYNSSKLEYEVLPNLPNVSPTSSVPKTTLQYPAAAPAVTKVDKKDAIKISSGTKFQTKSVQTITDRIKEGSTVTFTTTAPVTLKNITIPTGTKIYGLITDAHTAQKTGNGGLVVIRINALNYKGKTYSANGKITKANMKKVFFNNIKGKRQYLAGVAKQVDKGERFYAKTKKTANRMSNNPILVILSPVPIVVGYAGYAVCTVLSPLTGLSNPGGNLSIPAGSNFEIKLLDDAFVY